MKKYIFIGVVLFFSLFRTAYAQSERIVSFQSIVTIYNQGEVRIDEKIVYDFGNKYRHGIYRTIPFIYTNKKGDQYKADIAIQGVSDEKGVPYSYSLSKKGTNYQLKIGDPNKTIQGVHTYIISYIVKGIVQEFSDHLELYLNVTGTDWQVPIEKAQVQVLFASNGAIPPSTIKAICFTGEKGSREKNCTISHLGRKITASTTRNYLTIVVSFPLGSVTPIPLQLVSTGDIDKLSDMVVGFIAVANIILSFIIVVFWYIKGRDPQNTLPVVRTFDPPKNIEGRTLTPMEVGTIVDEWVNSRDISGEIIDLAVKGYITIHEGKKKFFGLKTGDLLLMRGPSWKKDSALQNIPDHQKELLDALGLVGKEKIDIKKDKAIISLKIQAFIKTMYDTLTKDGFFPEDPQKRRTKYLITGVVLIFFSLMVPGMLFIFFSFFMGRKTLLGVKAKKHALGLKEFLVTQKRQYAFQEKEKYLFEKLLPYAIVFGVAKIWAKKFENLSIQPDWYQSETGKYVNSYILTSHLEQNLSHIQGVYTPTSSSSRSGFSSGFSGGGFSGGGFGGGGGGSW